ncbi:MAG: PKD domain-containing protein [Bacteroidota bacterium]
MKKFTWVFCILIFSGSMGYAQWTEQATGFATASRGIRSVYAVSNLVVWAAAYDGSGGSAPCQDITMTTNGGTLWTPHTIAGVTNLDIANIVAIDASKAWVCMFPPGSTTTGQGIYKTTNGGVTWTRQATATFSNASSFPDLVYFWDQNTGYCMGDPINGEFEIYTTADGGTTWTIVSGASIPNPLTGEFGVIGYYSAVGNTTWFGTNMGRIYKSTDNGHNWTVSAITGWGTKYVQPFFRDALNGLVQDKSVSSTGSLVKTTDGGTTWTAVTTTGNVFTDDMAYIPGTTSTWVTTGAASGFTGVTYSFNDGVAWTDMATTIGTQFLATDWINNSTGWAGSFNVDATTGGMYKFNSTLAEPIANFSANVTNIAPGGQVQFTDLSAGGPTAWQWSFPGGTPASSTLQTPPPITYSTAGQYTVTLTITCPWGTDSEVKTNYIVVNASAAPVANFTANVTVITAGGQVSFSDLSTGNPTTWQWTFPGGTPGSSTQQTPPAITYATAGVYNVSLTVTNSFGSNTNTKVNYITVNNPAAPAANFTANQTNITTGAQVQFTDLSTGSPTTWQWTFPGGTPGSSTLQSPPLIAYNTAGQYDVTLTVTNAGGSSTNTKVQYIIVTNPVAPPVSNFTANQTNIIAGGQIQFTDLSTGTPTTWQWTFAGGTPGSSTLQTPPLITYSTAGQYDVSLTVTNAGGSSTNTKSQYITVTNPAAPVANFTANQTNIAAGGQVQFTDLSTGNPTSWIWNFPGGNPASAFTQTPPLIIYSAAGQYDVTLTALNPGGSSTNTKVKYIHVGNIGMEESDPVKALVYPNPATTSIMIKSKVALNEIALLDQVGMVILSETVNAPDYVLYIDHIPPGVYILKFTSGSGCGYKKVVISK